MSQPWLHRVVDHLLRERKLSLLIVVRRRHRLAELLRIKIASHGRAQVRRATEWLIQMTPDAIETSDDFAVTIDEQGYRPCISYRPVCCFSARILGGGELLGGDLAGG